MPAEMNLCTAGDVHTLGHKETEVNNNMLVCKPAFPEDLPPLSGIDSLLVFDALSKDHANHDANWRSIESEGEMRKIPWVNNEHEMTEEERLTALSISSKSLGDNYSRHVFYVFARVEKGIDQ